MTSRMIPLDQLRFGHEAEPPINARRTGRETEIPELAASIGAHGLQMPLKVKEGHDRDGVAGIFVGIGNRRLAALRLLVEKSQMAADAAIECREFDAVVDAREAALAEQINRVALHPADEYVEFHALAGLGISEASIASRFGIDPKRVKRILALGQLSPLVLDWWREQGAASEAFSTVCAFTLAPTLEDQETLFKKLDKRGDIRAWSVNRALGADNHDAARAIKIAGLDAYKAAGGHYTQDLFGDNHVIQDPEIATQVANDKINAVLAGLKVEGWAWVSTAGELPYSWSYGWSREKPSDGKTTSDEKKQIKKLEKTVAKTGDAGCAEELAALQKTIADRQWTPEQLAKAGAVLEISHHGDLNITRGVVKPAAAKKAASAPGEKVEKAPTISNAMHDRLSIQATLAVRSAIQQEPRLGLVALLAGFITHRHLHTDSPVRVYHDGFGKSHGGEKESFASAFARLSAMSDAELFVVAAGCAGEAVHMERPYAGKLPFDANAAPLAAAIDAGHMTAALLETFDAVDYFNGVAKPFIIQAIREAVNEDEARKADKLKKKELVEFAVKNVQPTGWLPPELRCATYSGPGEIPSPPVSAPPTEPEYDEVDEVEDLDEVA